MNTREIQTATDRILSGESLQSIAAAYGFNANQFDKLFELIRHELKRRVEADSEQRLQIYRAKPRMALNNLRTLSDYGDLTVGDVITY